MRVENLCDRSGIEVETIAERHAHAFGQSRTAGKPGSIDNRAPFRSAVYPRSTIATLPSVIARAAFRAGIGRIVILAPIAARTAVNTFAARRSLPAIVRLPHKSLLQPRRYALTVVFFVRPFVG
jgi:hypothetical protein